MADTTPTTDSGGELSPLLIVRLFTEIDEQISSLHEYSAKDFMRLNTLMKQFHSQARAVSVLTTAVCNYYQSDDKTAHSLSGFLEQINSAKGYLDAAHAHFSELESGIDRIQGLLAAMHVPLLNLKQNFLTLIYLHIHSRLDDQLMQEVDASSAHGLPGEGLSADVSEVCNSFADQILLFRDHNTEFSQLLKELISPRRAFDRAQLEQITDDLAALHVQAAQLNDTIPRLRQLTSNYSERINRIITNLQYHDIIKQKMEHIQKSHQYIIATLSNVAQAGQTTDNSYYIKIYEVNAVQAAQLLHTNSQYESAIEKITRNIFEIGQEMDETATLCSRIAESGRKYHLAFTEQLYEHIKSSLLQFRDTARARSDAAYSQTARIEQDTLSLTQLFSRVNDLYKRITRDMKAWLSLPENKVAIHLRDKRLKQRDLLQSIGKSLVFLSETIEALEGCVKEALEHFRRFIQAAGNAQFFDEQLPEIEACLINLQPQSVQIEAGLARVGSEGSRLADEIRESIENPGYYQHFDKVVVEISNKLNQISTLIEAHHKVENRLNEERITELRNNYTTRSEYMIHDKVVQEELNQLDVGALDPDNTSENDDNLELF